MTEKNCSLFKGRTGGELSKKTPFEFSDNTMKMLGGSGQPFWSSNLSRCRNHPPRWREREAGRRAGWRWVSGLVPTLQSCRSRGAAQTRCPPGSPASRVAPESQRSFRREPGNLWLFFQIRVKPSIQLLFETQQLWPGSCRWAEPLFSLYRSDSGLCQLCK